MTAKRNTDLVTYNILVGNTDALGPADEIDSTIPVSAIRVCGEINTIPEAVLTILDGDVTRDEFAFSDGDVFSLGKFIAIKMGYHGENQTVFKGIIINIKHTIRSGRSRLAVTCRHEAVKMTFAQRSRHYTDIGDGELINQLLTEHGISNVTVEGTVTTHEQLLQSQLTDWDFMVSRSDMNGLVCRIDGGLLEIAPIDYEAEPVMDLVYGDNIVEMDAEVDSRQQFTSVHAYSWNYATQDIEFTTAIGAEHLLGGPDTAELARADRLPYEMRTSAQLGTALQQAIVNAKYERFNLSKIKGDVKYPGNAVIKQGSFVNLRGVGVHFNGKAFVSAVEHEFEDGHWICTATLGWEGSFHSEVIKPDAPMASMGVLSLAKGLQIGIVTDMIDPAGNDRVKVRLPALENGSEGIYARVATLDAGQGRGTVFRPEVGDEVILGFVDDNAHYPVILGMLHSSAKPAPFPSQAGNHEKGYRSRTGVSILINDEDERIVIQTPQERKFTMDDSSDVVTIEDNQSNVIRMDTSGIHLQTSRDLSLDVGGKFRIKTGQLEAEANGTLKLKSNAGMVLESSGNTELKGSLVNINGGLVTIN